MSAAEYLREAVSAARDDLAALTPGQRFACDRRSIDRFRERYWDFARDAEREDLAIRMETILATLWRDGEASVADEAVRAIRPDDQEFLGYHFGGTAELLMTPTGSWR